MQVPYKCTRASASRRVRACKAHKYVYYSTSVRNVRGRVPLATRAYVPASIVLPLAGSVRALTSTRRALARILRARASKC